MNQRFNPLIASGLKALIHEYGDIVIISSISGPGNPVNELNSNRVSNNLVVLNKNKLSLYMGSRMRTTVINMKQRVIFNFMHTNGK